MRLARDGFDVALNYVSSRSEAEAAAKEIRLLGGQSVALQADVADTSSARALVLQAMAEFGRLDVLVINAGGAVRKPFGEVTESDYERQFALVRSAFFSMQEAAGVMQPDGRIVVISSAATRNCPADAAVYAGAKSAMEAFARSLSRELGPRNITVNVVAPGATNTDLMKGAPRQVIESVKRNAFGRMAEVADIADAVAMLCGPDARWITGQIVRADGGL